MGAPRNDLDLLAVAHYGLAALTALFAVFPALYLALGSVMLSGRFDTGRGPAPPAFFGWFLIAFGAAFLVATLAYAALVVLAGRSLKSRRRWTFCLVMAAVSCAFFPFGTILGVFTILTLSRPEARALFGAAPLAGWSGTAPTAPPPPSSPPAGG